MNKKYILLGLFLALAGVIQAQETLSLSQAIQKGLEKNYQIQIVEQNVEIAKNNNTWGAAGALPTLDFSLANANSMSEGPSMWTGQVENTQSYMFTPSVNLNWVIFSGFRVRIAKENLEELESLSMGNSALVIENAIQGIVLAYYQVALDQKSLKTMQELEKLSRDRFNYIQQKNEFGNVGTYEVLQAKTAFLADSSNILMAQMNLNASRGKLNMLLAESSSKVFVVDDELPLYLYDFEYGNLYSSMIDNNQTLKNQYINLNILKNTTRMKRSAFYPNLSLRAGTSTTAGTMEFENFSIDAASDDYYANFTLSFNLFNGGNTRLDLKNAKIQEQIGRLQIDEMQASMSIQLKTFYDLYLAQKQLYKLTSQQLEAAELNLQLSKERYEMGAINSFNYRDIQIQYQNASLNHLEASYNLISTYLEIVRLTGGLVKEFSK